MALLIPNVPVSSSASGPVVGGPTPAAVCNWYRRELERSGVVVTPTADDELEFEVASDGGPWGSDAERVVWFITGGELWVDHSPAGFTVHVNLRPVPWAVLLPLVWLLLASGGFAFQEGLLHPLLTFGGLPLVLYVWGNIWLSWAMFLNRTNRAVVRSYSDRPSPATQGGAAV